MCVRAFAEALEVIPYTLAENAGNHNQLYLIYRIKSN